jgi:hypothetical protein
MWIGHVELLFKASFKNAQGEAFEFDLAHLSCLYYFEHLSAMAPLQTEAGARMFYVPSTPWTIVLPINHILCRVPLMLLFLAGSDVPTIPHSFARDTAQYFQYGCADQRGRRNVGITVGSCSCLFELNVHLRQFAQLCCDNKKNPEQTAPFPDKIYEIIFDIENIRFMKNRSIKPHSRF